jgi:hypothetical protein
MTVESEHLRARRANGQGIDARPTAPRRRHYTGVLARRRRAEEEPEMEATQSAASGFRPYSLRMLALGAFGRAGQMRQRSVP